MPGQHERFVPPRVISARTLSFGLVADPRPTITRQESSDTTLNCHNSDARTVRDRTSQPTNPLSPLTLSGERDNNPDDTEACRMTENLMSCPRCGALVEAGIDCREALSCPGDPDQQLLAPYMSPYIHYDLGNCYDREIIRLDINGCIRRCREYHALADRLRTRGFLSEEQYAERASGVLATLQRHLDALTRLNELEGNAR